MCSYFSDRTVSKIEAAMIQIDASIKAYQQQNDIVSITLAGAAEEILGKMCQGKGLKNSIDELTELEPLRSMFDKQYQRIDILNSTRNNLKHYTDGAEKDFKLADLDAFVMIARSLRNAQLLGVEDTELMTRFRNGEFIREFRGEK